MDWVGAVTAVTAPAAGAKANPVTAQTTAKRAALPARAVMAARPASATAAATAAAATA